jgi:2-iminobutanoate/2-iminopropanoate deaminase
MKQIIKTSKAPAPIGPYNQAVLNGGLVFTSGQIAIDPITGKLDNADIRTETSRVMENLKAVLAEVNMTFEDVLKSTIFISNMNDFKTINEVYATYFDGDNAPARETVEVARLPKDVNIEISMVAAKKD